MHDKNLRRIFRDGKEEPIADFNSAPETFAYDYIFGKQKGQRRPSPQPFGAVMADSRPSPDSIIPASHRGESG
ncbi:hypothetical protein [Allomesorhizobium camelthorni]|uniref:Uncharacterized protein n=1 Tax=Allomesorhizobium camelthorni TaxID=475069 RepID=A0A6G4WHH4_9HYPH|nr:hypothetical protein [Mesorhizobium camelthorni]NGO54049.1 hypothetical protein [Mesorhizobium camelthorni]